MILNYTMKEERSDFMDLPKRRDFSYLNAIAKKTKVITNYYPVNIKVFKTIYIFKVVIQPHIEQDNRAKRQSLLKQAMPSIKKQIENPIIGGMNIFSASPPIEEQGIHEINGHKIYIKKVKQVDMDKRDMNKILLQFLNNGIRNIMKSLNYMEIGQTRKYFDQSKKKQLFNGSLNIYSGFKTSVLAAEGGLFLRIDPTKKIVQNISVMDFIETIYHKPGLERDQRRQMVRQTLINKIVMVNYGKTRFVKIIDIEFRILKEVMLPKNSQGRQLNILQYYKEKYSLQSQRTKSDVNRPLLRVQNKNKKDPNPTYILPQYCLITGIPDDVDQYRRKIISEQTTKKPNEKNQQILSFVQKMRKGLYEKQFQGLGIQIQKNPRSIQGFHLQNPTLYLGDCHKVQRGKQSGFPLFNKPIFDNRTKLRLCILCSRPQIFNQIKQSIAKTCSNLKLDFTIDFCEIKETNQTNLFVERITELVKRTKEKNKSNCCLIILPSKLKHSYPLIKKRCLEQVKILTQIMVDSTLKKKSYRSIETKIILQMAAKIGNTLWATSNPKQLVGKTMLLSFQFSKYGKKSKVCGVTTVDKNMSKLISQSRDIADSIDKFKAMKCITLSLISKYVQVNKQYPQNLIILTESCPQNQVKLYYQYFIPQFKDLGKNQINLTLIQIRDLSSQRFFTRSSDGTLMNPNSGLLVRDTIVKSLDDFYFVSQRVSTGCVVPIYFNIVYAKQRFEIGVIQELLYSQCFNYANWTGSIKIPAILQYAKKFARFCSEVLGPINIENDELCQKPYYI